MARDLKTTDESVMVVVLNWNGIADTVSCLDSLWQQDYAALEILVVDNNSSDHSLEVLRPLAESGRIQLLENSSNLGFAGGVNSGISYAIARGVEAVALVNNDALPSTSWVSNLASELFTTRASIATGLLLDGGGKRIDTSGDFYSRWGMPYPRERGKLAEEASSSGPVFSASGGGSLYRTELFQDIGMFDEKFFAYFEDVDLSFRAQLQGKEIRFVRDAVALHRRGSSSSKVAGFTTYQSLKNLPLVFWRNLPASTILRVGPRFALLYLAILANAVRTGRGRPALRGACEGFALVFTHALPTRREIQRRRSITPRSVSALLTSENPFRPHRYH
ncbi:glycosyltransferase family 2 protein [Microbacterium memoriense]|uniref:Glycosyltransferase family 2 protein n=1 Tax=Microbacterium memoriense TaxID=2978350 RepID=A0ABT2PB64_9MICO|nr:glycosyltransferase family 2 protein [Microbacterium memoriense]MCT9001818.1 glycosyltransferase family 2 protein [Microbacterium memoriense]